MENAATVGNKKNRTKQQLNQQQQQQQQVLSLLFYSINFYLFKKLLFTMENATTAGSSQSNISRLYF